MKKILVVTAYPDSTNRLVEFFNRNQYDIHICRPDISMFQKIMEDDYYCLILDFYDESMNDINQIIKVLKPFLPTIALLDEKGIEHISQISQSGIFYTFIKPAGLADIGLLEKALQRHYQNLEKPALSSTFIKTYETLKSVPNFRKMNPRIALLVTNDSDIRDRFSRMLHQIDVTYIFEKNIFKAFLQLLQYPYHLIIYDADEDLSESQVFIKLIKQIRPRLHVLVTISELILTKAETFLSSGATKVVIKKPLETFDLNYADSILKELNL